MRLFPILVLLGFTTILPEFFVGRQLITWLDPGTFLMLFLGYGLVILVMREFAVRHNIGVLGLFLWGLAYGVINEGLLAKTMILSENLPVNFYDGYGVVFGISWPWSVAISLWHAMAAVVFPILLVHAFFPKQSKEQWIGQKTAYVLGLIVLLLISAVFLGNAEQQIRGTPVQLAIFVVIMVLLFTAGLLFKGNLRTTPVTSGFKPLFFGLSVIIPFWVLNIMAAAKISPLVFFLTIACVTILYAVALHRTGWIALPGSLYFGIGWYLHNSLQAFVILLTQNPLIALTTIVLQLLILFFLYWRVGKTSFAAV